MQCAQLSMADVKRLLKDYLRYTTKMSFYYHTDRTSTEKIGRILMQAARPPLSRGLCPLNARCPSILALLTLPPAV